MRDKGVDKGWNGRGGGTYGRIDLVNKRVS